MEQFKIEMCLSNMETVVVRNKRKDVVISIAKILCL